MVVFWVAFANRQTKGELQVRAQIAGNSGPQVLGIFTVYARCNSLPCQVIKVL